MEEHRNAARVRELFRAFRERDVDAVLRILPEDVAWHFPGRKGKLAGDHRGREAVIGFLMNVQTLTDGTFHLDLVDVVANDDKAVALFRGHGDRDGKKLDNPTCLLLAMRDGQVAEVWEFVWDLYHVDEFWS